MKLMVMTLVVAMLLSMSAFAASVSYTGLVPTLNEAGTDYSVVVNYAAADYATGDQITMLVLKDSAEITWVEGSNDTIPANVIYIDQETIEGATGSFTFTIAKDAVDGKNVYVKLGATSQAEADEDSYTFTTTTEDGTTLEVSVSNTASNAFGTTGLSVVTVTPVGELPEGKTLKVNGAEVFYKEYNGVKKYIVAVVGFDATTSKFEIVDGTMRKVVFGVLTGNGTNPMASHASMVNRYAAGVTLSQFTNDLDYMRIKADVSGDGKILASDASLINRRAAGMSVNFAAENK